VKTFKARLIAEFEFETDADSVGDAQVDALRFVQAHIMDDEDQRPIRIKRLAIGEEPLTLDKGHIDQVEHNISPPMRKAITLPIELGGGKRCAVYVALGGFTALNYPISNEELQTIAKRLEVI